MNKKNCHFLLFLNFLLTSINFGFMFGNFYRLFYKLRAVLSFNFAVIYFYKLEILSYI